MQNQDSGRKYILALTLLVIVKITARSYYLSQVAPQGERQSCSQSRSRVDPKHLRVPEEVLQRRAEHKVRYERVLASLKSGDRAAAKTVLDEAIAAEPEDAEWYLMRATLSEDCGDHAKAIADYEALLRLSPEVFLSHQKLAWILATSPNAKVRDGGKAVEHALRSLELAGDSNWECLDTAAVGWHGQLACPCHPMSIACRSC